MGKRVSRLSDFSQYFSNIYTSLGIVFAFILGVGTYAGSLFDERVMGIAEEVFEEKIGKYSTKLADLEKEYADLESLREEVDVAYKLRWIFNGRDILEHNDAPELESFYAEQGQRVYITLKTALGSKKHYIQLRVNGVLVDEYEDVEMMDISCMLRPDPISPRKDNIHNIGVSVNPVSEIDVRDKVEIIGYILLKKRNPRDENNCKI